MNGIFETLLFIQLVESSWMYMRILRKNSVSSDQLLAVYHDSYMPLICDFSTFQLTKTPMLEEYILLVIILYIDMSMVSITDFLLKLI